MAVRRNGSLRGLLRSLAGALTGRNPFHRRFCCLGCAAGMPIGHGYLLGLTFWR